MWALAGCLALGGCGERPLEPRDPTPGVAHFKIATYNLEFRHYDDPATVEAVGATRADIIALQEVSGDWEPVLRARYAAEYPHMLFRPGATSGLAVLSRAPLIDDAFHPALESWHPAWTVLAQSPAGWLKLLVVHLRALSSGSGGIVSDYVNWGSDHRSEIQTFYGAPSPAELPAELASIVLGDFNEGPDGDAIRFLEAEGFRNALPLYRPGQFTWRHRSLGGQFNETLDHILFDENMLPLNAYVVSRGHSDHLPVVAHLEAAGEWMSFDPTTHPNAGRF